MPYKDRELGLLKQRERSKKWQAENPEKAAAYKRAQRKRNPERDLAKYREWYHERGGKEKVAVYKTQFYCPNRAKSRDLKRAYRLTLDEYEAMVKSQDGKCKICGKDNADTKYKRSLFVDHCHVTGKIRGLLCHRCNTGIGYFRDNVEALQAAAAYLGSFARLQEAR